MWIINDEKAREFVTALFPDETEISDAYEYQKDNDDDSVKLIAYEGVKARANMRIKKALFKEVREYDPNDWNPYPEVKPPANGRYLVTRQMKIDNGDTAIFIQLAGFENGQWFMKNDVIAFRELPQPYHPKYERKPWDDDDSEPEEGD